MPTEENMPLGQSFGLESDAVSRRRAIVVAGMHRSGTSAITRVLAMLGADLPVKLGAPAADNESGFWEPLEIVQTHQRLLVAAGSAWDDVSPIDEEWFTTAEGQEYEDRLLGLLQSNYGNSPLFVLKDPRLCRLIPLWLRVLERFGAEPAFVISVRSPLEVAASLRVRDGFSTQKSQLLWLRYMLDAERFSRGHDRSFVSYERLLLDWMPVAERIAGDLGLTWSRVNHATRVEIDRFLSPTLRHHTISDEELSATSRVIPAVARLYALLNGAAGEHPVALLPQSKRTLDRMYRELGNTDRTYGPLLAEERIVAAERMAELERGAGQELETLRSELGAGRERLEADAGERIGALTAQASALSAEVQALQRTIEERARQQQASQAESEEQRRRMEAALVDREEALLVSAAEVQSLAQRLSALQQGLAEGQRELAVREQTLAELEARLAEREAQDGRSRVEQLTGEIAQLEAERAEAETAALALGEAGERALAVQEDLRDELAMQAEALTAGRRRAKALTAEVTRLQSDLLELDAQLQEGTRRLQAQERESVASERRLQAELAHRNRELAASQVSVHTLAAQLAEQEAELSRRDKNVRSVGSELALARKQLDARPGVKVRRRVRGVGVAIGAPLVGLSTGSRRWWTLTRWLVHKRTRPLARAYFGLRGTGAFDTEFYLANYRDVARSGLDPLLHYIQYGVRDRYDPSDGFSTAAYLAAHPDLLQTGENPLLHALRVRRPGSALALAAGDPAAEPQDSEQERPDSPAIASERPTEAVVTEARMAENGVPGAAGALVAIPRAAIVILASEDMGSLPGALSGHRVWHLAYGSRDLGSGQDGIGTRTEIEALRAKGAGYLVFVGRGRAELARAPELRDHLNSKYRCLADSSELTMYELTARRSRLRAKHSYRTPGWGGLDVICMPIIDWSYRFQRPQQLMTQFAKRGHRVFYVATTFQRDSRRPAVGDLADNVWGVRLPGRPEVNIYTDEASDEIVDKVIDGLAALREEAHIGPAVVVADLPFWAPVALESQTRWGWKLIYDCMDEHGGFVVAEDGGLEQRRMIDAQERILLDRSDLVLTASRLLHEKASSISRNVLMVRNAADFEHFLSAANGPLAPSVVHPVIGYYGAISSWFDSSLIGYAARERPEWSFVLAGRTTGADLTPIEGLPNVHFLGELPYAAVPGLLHQFDVACIPFHLIDLTLATNPVKFYEYMTAGKPVVSVRLPELEQYEDYFYPVGSPSEFVTQIDRALEEDSATLRLRRVQLGRENTWADRYETLVAEIRPWYRKAAVIVTSFDNPEYLRQCLDSLRDKTEYPNFEVIVVDNGSDQGLVDELVARREHDPRLRVLAQGENTGFARANNVGIEAAADADYIVLLNDDTVVTQGWLGRLIGHLQDDSIGLVGPVSNWAGNEARIDVPYTNTLSGLDQFAARRAEQRRGEVSDIPVLAMYCVAARKRFIDELGGLDERFRIGMFEDDDFAMRVRQAGKRVICAEDVFIHHWGRASFGRMSESDYDALFEANKRVYEEIWNRRWVPHRARQG